MCVCVLCNGLYLTYCTHARTQHMVIDPLLMGLQGEGWGSLLSTTVNWLADPLGQTSNQTTAPRHKKEKACYRGYYRVDREERLGANRQDSYFFVFCFSLFSAYMAYGM